MYSLYLFEVSFYVWSCDASTSAISFLEEHKYAAGRVIAHLWLTVVKAPRANMLHVTERTED